MPYKKIEGLEEIIGGLSVSEPLRQIPTHEHYRLLADVYRTTAITSDERHQVMLYNLGILEYNGKQFYDINPVVKLILMRDNLIDDREIREEWHDLI